MNAVSMQDCFRSGIRACCLPLATETHNLPCGRRIGRAASCPTSPGRLEKNNRCDALELECLLWSALPPCRNDTTLKS